MKRLTPIVKASILDSIRAGLTIEDALIKVDMEIEDFRSITEKDSSFLKEIEKAKVLFHETILKHILKNIGRSPNIAWEFLKNRFPEAYSKGESKNKVEESFFDKLVSEIESDGPE